MSSLPQTSETVGSYVIEQLLARGSMGSVYAAHHTLTHARVALKVLHEAFAGDEQTEERFLREVRAAAHIGHEGIVRVHDAGRDDIGRLYLAMELLEGETLEERLRRGAGERSEALWLLYQVLEPLGAAHNNGIIHRDLKPANVFIARTSDGGERIKLLDFGLARDMSEKSVTAAGIAMGTPYYMSPEQATQPKDASAASDVWSMGVMMYEVLCGVMPFDGETLHAVVIHSAVTTHVPTAERATGIDPALCALVDQCLSKAPHERPADANALRERLGELLAEPALQASLTIPIQVIARLHQGGTSGTIERMPFAETAISLPPAELMEPPPRADRGSSATLWVSALVVVVLAVAGYFWLSNRATVAQPTAAGAIDADSVKPAPPATLTADDPTQKPKRTHRGKNRNELAGDRPDGGELAEPNVGNVAPPPEPGSAEQPQPGQLPAPAPSPVLIVRDAGGALPNKQP